MALRRGLACALAPEPGDVTFAYGIFERSELRKLRAEKLKARQVDDLCDRFNVTVV